MLAYSLTGNVEANMRKTTLRSQADQSLKSITLSPLHLQAKRGEVTIQPITISGNAIQGKISGAFDLANNPLSGLEYQLQERCGMIKGDLFSQEVATNECTKSATSETVKPEELSEKPDAQKETEPAAPISEINIELQEEETIEGVIEEDEPTENDVAVDEELAAE